MTARHRTAQLDTSARYLIAALLGAVTLVLAVVLVVPWASQSSRTGGQGHPAANTAAAAAAPTLHVIGAGPAAPTPSAAAEQPVRIRIPAIGVDSGLQRLGLLANGTLQPPSRWAVAGWYAGGVAPGQVGPAVIAGHVDSTKGPAVFFRLTDLAVGNRVQIDDRNGTSMTFRVDSIRRFAKSAFPTEAVYGAVPDPELRLVTCTGTFDTRAHSYLDNLVVSAHLVSS